MSVFKALKRLTIQMKRIAVQMKLFEFKRTSLRLIECELFFESVCIYLFESKRKNNTFNLLLFYRLCFKRTIHANQKIVLLMYS